jgi:hypothetical protein
MADEHELPPHLAIALEDAEEAINDAQDRMNGVQRRIALWHCSEGRHVYGLYTTPPIGRACIYCQQIAPEQDVRIEYSGNSL